MEKSYLEIQRAPLEIHTARPFQPLWADSFALGKKTQKRFTEFQNEKI
jgi:hypothetical protein